MKKVYIINIIAKSFVLQTIVVLHFFGGTLQNY